MNKSIAFSGTFAAVLSIGSANAAQPLSFFPERNLGPFLAKNFDLATIRSSLGPRRSEAQRTFGDMGMRASKATDNSLVFNIPGRWVYELEVLARSDVNGDGIEDLEVCFRERALNGGTYDSSQGLLLTRYSATGYALAIRFGINNSACPEFAH